MKIDCRETDAKQNWIIIKMGLKIEYIKSSKTVF